MPRRSVATGCMQKVGVEDENLGSGLKGLSSGCVRGEVPSLHFTGTADCAANNTATSLAPTAMQT